MTRAHGIVASVALLAAAALVPRTAAGASAIAYHAGRLSARIDNHPLVDVVRELGAATGARVILRSPGSDPGGDHVVVSAAVDAQPFVEGVRRILRGFSYVIYTRGDTDLPTVIVFAPEPTAGVPLQRAAPQPPAPAEGPREAEQAEAFAREQAEREETFQQALTALQAAQRANSQQALDQLVGLREDPRVTQVLVQAVSEAAESDARVRATTALWHHTADLGFTDAAAVSTLEQLADDADNAVQKIARQALADMQQYRQHIPTP